MLWFWLCDCDCGYQENNAVLAIIMLLFFSQEIVLKRAADLAEALYSMPRNPNQLSLPPPRSPAMNNSSAMSGFNTYTGQLAVSVQEAANGQWEEGWLVPLSNLHHKCAILSIPYAFLLTCVFFINYPNTLYHFICPFYTLFLVSLSFMIHLFSSPFYRAHALI